MLTELILANFYAEILPPQKLPTGFRQPVEDAVDLGGYSTLECAMSLLTPGTGTGGATLVLESAATRNGEYFPIPGASMVIDSTGVSKHVQADSFLRFVRAAVVGSVGGTPVGGVGVIAKR